MRSFVHGKIRPPPAGLSENTLGRCRRRLGSSELYTKRSSSWRDHHERLEELESRVTMRIADEHIVIVDLHRDLVREPENVLHLRGFNGCVIHGCVLAFKPNIAARREKPGLELQDMEGSFIDPCKPLHQNYGRVIAGLEGREVSGDVRSLREANDVAKLLSNRVVPEVSKSALGLI